MRLLRIEITLAQVMLKHEHPHESPRFFVHNHNKN